MRKFETVILGDNPFFGVDHLSHERGRLRTANKTNFDEAIQVIKNSYELGVKDISVSMRPNLGQFLDEFKSKTDLVDKFRFHPLVPYAQGYVLKSSQTGLMGILKEVLKNASFVDEVNFFIKGGIGFLKKDFKELFKIFLDYELLKLKNLNLGTVFLHPILTDLFLAFNLSEIFKVFIDHVHEKYNADAGFSTKNFPFLVNKVQEWKLDRPVIMSSFNKVGYLMNPSKEDCEEALRDYTGKVLAMNIFAGGYTGLTETMEYLDANPKIKNVIIGVSSIKHAKETFQLIKS